MGSRLPLKRPSMVTGLVLTRDDHYGPRHRRKRNGNLADKSPTRRPFPALSSRRSRCQYLQQSPSFRFYVSIQPPNSYILHYQNRKTQYLGRFEQDFLWESRHNYRVGSRTRPRRRRLRLRRSTLNMQDKTSRIAPFPVAGPRPRLMAVIAAVLSVVMTSVGIRAATVRMGGRRLGECHKAGDYKREQLHFILL